MIYSGIHEQGGRGAGANDDAAGPLPIDSLEPDELDILVRNLQAKQQENNEEVASMKGTVASGQQIPLQEKDLET